MDNKIYGEFVEIKNRFIGEKFQNHSHVVIFILYFVA